MKISHIALAAAAVAFSTPAFAVEVPVATKSDSATSGYKFVEAGNSGTTVLALTAGTYTLNLLTSGATSIYAKILSQVYAVSTIDGSTIGLIANQVNYKTVASDLTGSYSGSFTISDTPNVVYTWLNSVAVRDGTASYTATITKAVAVPGPEAGVGAGALAMAGVAMYLKRRRRDDVVAA